jgi:hypothetical protein
VSDRQITVTLDEEVVRRFLAGRAGNPVVDALNAALDNSQTPSGEEGEGEGAKERAEIRRLAGALHHESDLQAVRSLKAMADARLEQYNEAVKREADERTHREFAVQKVKELEAERAAHPHDQETPQVSSGDGVMARLAIMRSRATEYRQEATRFEQEAPDALNREDGDRMRLRAVNMRDFASILEAEADHIQVDLSADPRPSTLTDEERGRLTYIADKIGADAAIPGSHFLRSDADLLRTLAGKEQR